MPQSRKRPLCVSSWILSVEHDWFEEPWLKWICHHHILSSLVPQLIESTRIADIRLACIGFSYVNFNSLTLSGTVSFLWKLWINGGRDWIRFLITVWVTCRCRTRWIRHTFRKTPWQQTGGRHTWNLPWNLPGQESTLRQALHGFLHGVLYNKVWTRLLWCR